MRDPRRRARGPQAEGNRQTAPGGRSRSARRCRYWCCRSRRRRRRMGIVRGRSARRGSRGSGTPRDARSRIRRAELAGCMCKRPGCRRCTGTAPATGNRWGRTACHRCRSATAGRRRPTGALTPAWSRSPSPSRRRRSRERARRRARPKVYSMRFLRWRGSDTTDMARTPTIRRREAPPRAEDGTAPVWARRACAGRVRTRANPVRPLGDLQGRRLPSRPPMRRSFASARSRGQWRVSRSASETRSPVDGHGPRGARRSAREVLFAGIDGSPPIPELARGVVAPAEDLVSGDDSARMELAGPEGGDGPR